MTSPSPAPLPQTAATPIVPTKLLLAVYVREKAGKLEVVIDDKCGDMTALHDATFAARQAIEARFGKRYTAWLEGWLEGRDAYAPSSVVDAAGRLVRSA